MLNVVKHLTMRAGEEILRFAQNDKYKRLS